MNWWNSKKIRKWLRIFHRDIGYFAVGVSLVYAVSGIILNHKNTGVDPAYKTIIVSNNIKKNLSTSELKNIWTQHFQDIKLNRVVPADSYYKLFLSGGVGEYSPLTGLVELEIFQKRPVVHFINKLHYNQKINWSIMADFSAIALIFLAISGLFMVAGKNGFRKRGVWFMIAGFVLVVIYIWI